MKTVEVLRDYDYQPVPQWGVRFLAGYTYRRVLERAARALEIAGAGRIIPAEHVDGAAGFIDAFPAFDVRRRRRFRSWSKR